MSSASSAAARVRSSTSILSDDPALIFETVFFTSLKDGRDEARNLPSHAALPHSGTTRARSPPKVCFLSDRRRTGGADLAIEFKDGGHRVVCFAFQSTDGPI